MEKHPTHHSKSRSNSFLADDERRSLRNSILKVFRAHLDSTQTSEQVGHCTEKHTKTKSPTGMGGLRHRKDNDDTIQKVKKRHTRSERNKMKLKQHAKCPKKEDEFRKQVKLAEEISSHSAKTTGSLASAAITSDRLTMRIGLYNNAKKSDVISRGPLHLSENMRSKTEEDMKRILDLKHTGLGKPTLSPSDISLANDEDQPITMDLDPEQENLPSISSIKRRGRLHSKVKRVSPSEISYNSPKVICHSPKVNHSSWDITSHSLGTTSTNAESKDGNSERNLKTQDSSMDIDRENTDDTDFPQSPPLSEIAANLFGGFRSRKIFRDRRYYTEVKDELYKMLKQSSQKYETPMELGKSTMSGSVSSATVRRSPKQSPCSSTGKSDKASACKQLDQVSKDSQNSASQQTQTSPSLSSVHYIQEMTGNHSTTTCVDALTEIQKSDVCMTAQTVLKSSLKHDSLRINSPINMRELMNARKLLAENDEAMRDVHELNNFDVAEPAASSQKLHSSLSHNISPNVLQLRPCNLQSPTSHHGNMSTRLTLKRAVAEYIVSPNRYMPGFHETYTGIQQEILWPHQTSTKSLCDVDQDSESMDILEYLDDNSAKRYLPASPLNARFYECSTSRQSQGSPGSDSSVSYVSAPSLPRPPIDAISPPKFYPQKMF